jgi:4-hydroxy-4-methyl-2-oxoglutarate aldolase
MDLGIVQALGSSTICEAAGVACALEPVLRPIWRGAAMVGPAFTIRCAPGDNLAIHIGLEQAPAGSVLVVDAEGSACGFWGEVLTVAAMARGVAGLVIDGSVRDVDALERHRFPVFARGVSMKGTIKQVVPLVGEPMLMLGVTVAPGDLVVADADGVLCLDRTLVSRTIDAATARQAKETEYIAKLADGVSTVELLGLQRFRR